MAKRNRLDKFGGKEWNFNEPICNSCASYTRNGACLAFPKGIPREIIIGEVKHDKPLSYQTNEIVYEELDLES